MPFDISKTETFVPFLWILSKAITVVSLFGLLSVDWLHWNITDAATPPPATTAGLVSATIPTTVWFGAWDRLLAVLVMVLVLCERGLDMLIISRSDVTQKVTKKTLTGLNTHIVNDVCVWFGLVYAVRKQQNVCVQGRHGPGLMLASLLWFACGLLLFILEIQLKRKQLHHELDRNRHPFGKGVLANFMLAASPVLYYVGIVVLMAISITSPCLHHVFLEMAYTEFRLRLLLYALYVCGRCYTQGIPGDSYVDEMPNLVLFGWLVLLPIVLVYISMAVSAAAYVRLIAAPSVWRKGGASSMLLPTAVTDATTVVMKAAPVAPYAITSSSSSSSLLSNVDSERVPPNSNTSEFMAQLQKMENNMLLHPQFSHSSSSTTAKSTHASKRRNAPLF